MKMFKVCRACMNNLQYIGMNRFKLPKNDSIAECPMKPTCHGQPERSKREESERYICDSCNKVYSYMAKSTTTFERPPCERTPTCLDKLKSDMRCSEHCRNAVRDK